MKTQKLLITLLTFVLSTTSVYAEDESAEESSSGRGIRGPKTTETVQAQEKPAGELSNARGAMAYITIAIDPKVFPMGVGDEQVRRLNRLIREPRLVGSAYRQVLGTSEGWRDFEIEILEKPIDISGLQVVTVQLTARLKQEQIPAAKEILETYIEKVKAVLQKEYDFSRQLHAGKLEVYFHRKDQAERNLDDLLWAQNKLAGGNGKLDKESVRQRILEHEKVQMESSMQIAMLERRAQKFAEQIAGNKAMLHEADSFSDHIIELKNQRDQHRAEYLRIKDKRDGLLKQEERNAIENQLNNIQTELNSIEEERGKLRKHQQDIRDKSNAEIQELNHQLRETTIQLEELVAKQDYLRSYSPPSLSDSIQYEMLEVKIGAAKETLRKAIIQCDEAALEVDSLQPPTVTYDKINCFKTVPEEE